MVPPICPQMEGTTQIGLCLAAVRAAWRLPLHPRAGGGNERDPTTTAMPKKRQDPKAKEERQDENQDPSAVAESTSTEPAAEPEPEPQPPALVDELEAERARADENYDKYLRAVAELDNFRKRARQEIEEFRRYATEGLITELLAVVDNLGRALDSAEQNGDVGTLTQGVSLTLRQLIDILESQGLRAIEAEGRRFDPHLHEAVLRVDVEPDLDNVVIEELQRGYMLGDRVLRPAMVKVGMCVEPQSEEQPATDDE
jgi:molecular chaperone GrpE